MSRQPIQQAMALLKSDGLVRGAGGSRALTSRRWTSRSCDSITRSAAPSTCSPRHGALLVEDRAGVGGGCCASRTNGRSADLPVAAAAACRRDVRLMVHHDVAFHRFLYDVSGNPLLTDTTEPHWRCLRRVMGEVLRYAEPGAKIWEQHLPSRQRACWAWAWPRATGSPSSPTIASSGWRSMPRPPRPGWSRSRSTSAWSGRDPLHRRERRGGGLHRPGRAAGRGRGGPRTRFPGRELHPFRRRARPGRVPRLRGPDRRGQRCRARPERVPPDDPWTLMYTSGTTGKPKGRDPATGRRAVLSLVTEIELGFSRSDGRSWSCRCATPTRSTSSARSPIAAARRRLLPQELRPRALRATLAEGGATFTSLVPTHYIMMLDLPAADARAATTSTASPS